MNEMQQMVRVHYYNGQLLDARLFELEQNYVTQMINYQNQSLFSPGVVSGLVVKSMGAGGAFRISEGLAIDSLGRQLVWPYNGPAQVLPNSDACPGEEELVDVFLQWQETPVAGPAPLAKHFNEISLLPAVVFSGGQGILIATLRVVNGAIVAVDNQSRTEAKFKLDPSSQPLPSQPSSLVGSTSFSLDSSQPTYWVKVSYKKDGSQVFGQIPIVTATAVAAKPDVFNISLANITTAGFEAGITGLAGTSHQPGVEVTLNWSAAIPGGCTVQIGGGV